jgi:hypothetical protein
MQFESIGTIAMGDLSFKICGQIDDGNRFERASGEKKES